jgi:alpha-beta hydrolase superfamily lysophospholipase
MMVSLAQLSVLRMIPVAKRLVLAGRKRLAVYRLLNSSRGWNANRTPVDDVRWAIGQVHKQYPDRPVALVGHSLGGRAALLAGEQDAVRCVVALNAFVYPTDLPDLAGRQVLFVHGERDQIALRSRAAAVATSLGARGDVGFITVPGARHAMLRHGSVFERAAADYVAATMLGEDQHRSAAVHQLLDGQSWVTV